MFAGAAAQHLGPRDEQQDHIFLGPRLFAVADGNGILGSCSAQAVDRFRHHLHEAWALEIPTHNAIEKAVRCADEDLCTYLRGEVATVLESWRANERAMEAVEMLGQEFFENELGSGTTLTAFVDGSHLAHVGDSRAYRIDPARAEVTLLTRDHEWTPDDETVDIDGTIYKHGLAMARVLGHPQLRKHGVTAEPDVIPLSLGDGEFLVLCSDGFRPFFERLDGGPRLCGWLRERTLEDCARSAIEEVAKVATDNVSLILVGRC